MPPTFRTAVEAHDFDTVSELFADDITMRSPIARRIYRGRAAVIDVLRAVSTVFEDFTYEHEISSSSGDDHVLLFNARVSDFAIQGCDLLHYRDDGLIDQLTVMLRPLKAVLAFEERIRLAYARTVSTQQPTARVEERRPLNMDDLQVSTARGPIGVSDLGVTLMHEHVFLMTTEIMQNYPEDWGDGAQREVDAIARLDELKSRGVDTIVDLTVIGIGRYIPRIVRIAQRTEPNIVVATGLYTYNDLPMRFHHLGPGATLGGPEIMTEMFVRDIEYGIADTGGRAAILKCATDEPGVTPGVERVLRAVAQAHRHTEVPISTHTHAARRRGLDQQKIFAEEGVDLTRVVIGHSGDTTDLDYLEELTANGSYIGMDRFGIDALLSTEDRVKIVARMCERGHPDKMVLSHDASCYWEALPEHMLPTILPNWHYLHVHDDVIPALKSHGVTEEQLHTMLVDNPRKIFSLKGGY